MKHRKKKNVMISHLQKFLSILLTAQLRENPLQKRIGQEVYFLRLTDGGMGGGCIPLVCVCVCVCDLKEVSLSQENHPRY